MSRSKSPAQAPLAIDADLTLTRDGTDYRITATGDTVSIEAPSVSAVVALFRSLPDDQLDRFGPLLETTGLTVVVSVGDQRVATFEPDPGWEPDAGGFELRSFDIHARGIVVSLARDLGSHPIVLLGVALAVFWLVQRLRRRGEASDQS